jgi:hypothetical protein
VQNERLKAQLAEVEGYEVYRDLFHICLTPPIAAINDCRLGTLPSSPVPLSESHR